jgi:hypothetical protein
VFIINLPVGEFNITYRHQFQNVEQCSTALRTMVKNDKNVIAYCAPDNERYYNSTWFTDKKRNLDKE